MHVIFMSDPHLRCGEQLATLRLTAAEDTAGIFAAAASAISCTSAVSHSAGRSMVPFRGDITCDRVQRLALIIARDGDEAAGSAFHHGEPGPEQLSTADVAELSREVARQLSLRERLIMPVRSSCSL